VKPILLIVDDDEVFASDLKLLLESEYDCRWCADGKSARKMLEDGVDPEAVFLDVYLGDGMHGLDELVWIRGKDQDLPVIMMTDQPSIPLVVESVRRGAFSVLSKSSGIEELIDTLRKAVKFGKEEE
jgi:DNA-binding NtrC family response regulator